VPARRLFRCAAHCAGNRYPQWLVERADAGAFRSTLAVGLATIKAGHRAAKQRFDVLLDGCAPRTTESLNKIGVGGAAPGRAAAACDPGRVVSAELLEDLEHGRGLTEAAVSERTRAAYAYEFGQLPVLEPIATTFDAR
jgi:hypothetical protein